MWYPLMCGIHLLQHSPLDDIISDQNTTMGYCLIKNLAKENPVGKNSSEGKKSAVYSWLPLIWTSVALDVVDMSHSNVIHMLLEYCSRECLCEKICCIVAGLNIFYLDLMSLYKFSNVFKELWRYMFCPVAFDVSFFHLTDTCCIVFID